MSNYVLNTEHAIVSELSSAAIMACIATSAQRQASEATRLAMYAVMGCGVPECYKCYPSTTVPEPSYAEIIRAEQEAWEAEQAEDALAVVHSMRFVNEHGQWNETNAEVNVVLW